VNNSRSRLGLLLTQTYVLILTCIMLGFFSLKEFYTPYDRTLYSKEMIFDRIVSAGNSRFSRTQAFFDLKDGSNFKFHSNGLMLRYVSENLVNGKQAVVHWFDPCHELIPRKIMSCIEVIKINDSSLHDGQKSYLDGRRESFFFYAILSGIILLITLYGMFLTLTKWHLYAKD